MLIRKGLLIPKIDKLPMYLRQQLYKMMQLEKVSNRLKTLFIYERTVRTLLKLSCFSCVLFLNQCIAGPSKSSLRAALNDLLFSFSRTNCSIAGFQGGPWQHSNSRCPINKKLNVPATKKGIRYTHSISLSVKKSTADNIEIPNALGTWQTPF